MREFVGPNEIVSGTEILLVLHDLRRRARRSTNSLQNLVIFRLAACCGLRVREICALLMREVRPEAKRPHVYVSPRGQAERGRYVPVWDSGTLLDLRLWQRYRKHMQEGGPNDPFVCVQRRDMRGRPLSRHNIRMRFHAACRVLGRHVTPRIGRNSFCYHFVRHRSVSEVSRAAGHMHIAATERYLPLLAIPDDPTPKRIFDIENLWAPSDTRPVSASQR